MCYFCYQLKHNPSAPKHLGRNCRNRLNTHSVYAQTEYKKFVKNEPYACFYCVGLDYNRYAAKHQTQNCYLKGNTWSAVPEAKRHDNHCLNLECATCGVSSGEMGIACSTCILAGDKNIQMHCWQHCPKKSSEKK